MSAMTAHRAQLAQELRDELAASRWSEGALDHNYITCIAELVDGAAELMVNWSGYPTWEQLVELAQLCGVEPLYFTVD